jgi:hypothetical protein
MTSLASPAQPSGLVIAPDPYAVPPAPIAAAAAAAAATTDPYSDAASPAPAMAASAAPVVASSAAVGVAASAAAGVASPAAVAATAATSDKLNAGPGFPDVFLVEDIERRQGNVGDFLLAESDFVALSRVPRGLIRRQATRYRRYRRCATSEHYRQPGGPQHRKSFVPTLPFWSLFRVRHDAIPYQILRDNASTPG